MAMLLLEDTGDLSSKLVHVPIDHGVSLNDYDGDLVEDASSYRRLIGTLMYLKISHLDISYGVNKLSQFMQKPCFPHLNASII